MVAGTQLGLGDDDMGELSGGGCNVGYQCGADVAAREAALWALDTGAGGGEMSIRHQVYCAPGGGFLCGACAERRIEAGEKLKYTWKYLPVAQWTCEDCVKAKRERGHADKT